MVLLRPQAVIAALSGGMPSRADLSVSGIQLYAKTPKMEWVRKKQVILRNPPYTNMFPHTGQVEIRVQFGKLAKEAAKLSVEQVAREAGCQVYDAARNLVLCPGVGVLPKVAAYIMAKLKGFKAKHALPEDQYPSRLRRTYHTLTDLEKMLEEVAAATAAGGGR